MKAELYACVYALEFPVQARLRLRPELRAQAAVVMEGEPPLERVCSTNEKACKLGMEHGMSRAEVEICPQVHIFRRSRAEEQSAKAVLLNCAGKFSPRVEDVSSDLTFACVADLSGSEKLLGTPRKGACDLREQAMALGFQVSVAISTNFYTAVCLASGRDGTSVVAPGQERQALAQLSLMVLNLSPELAETFELWGICTLGALSELPEVDLITRLGQEGKRLRQLARGEFPHVMVPIEPECKFQETVEFDAPVELLDSLLFVLGPMIEQLITRAQASALSIAALKSNLALANRTACQRIVRPALPVADPSVLLKLLHLELIAHPPADGVLSVNLEAETRQPSRAQFGLFTPQFPEPARLDLTLARISALAGEDRIGAPELKDTHRREGFLMRRFAANPHEDRKKVTSRQAVASRILRPPEHLCMELQNGRPRAFVFRVEHYEVLAAYGPWLSSGSWWGEERWSLEQWDLIAISRSSPAPLCCHVLHCLLTHLWQMEALYD